GVAAGGGAAAREEGGDAGLELVRAELVEPLPEDERGEEERHEGQEAERRNHEGTGFGTSHTRGALAEPVGFRRPGDQRGSTVGADGETVGGRLGAARPISAPPSPAARRRPRRR